MPLELNQNTTITMPATSAKYKIVDTNANQLAKYEHGAGWDINAKSGETIKLKLNNTAILTLQPNGALMFGNLFFLYKEVTLTHNTVAVTIDELSENYGAVTLHILGTGNGINDSDAAAIITATKRNGTNGTVNVQSNTAGANGESFTFTWTNNSAPTLAFSINLGTLLPPPLGSAYTNTSTLVKLTIMKHMR